jgi:hypothetical protein
MTKTKTILSVVSFLSLAALVACSSPPSTANGSTDGSRDDSGDGPSDDTGDDTGDTGDTGASRTVGFWSAGPVSCGGQFDIAQGISLCSSKKMSGVSEAAVPEGSFEWLDQGTWSEDGETLTLSFQHTVVEPAEIRGDTNAAHLTLQRKGDKLVVVDGGGMPTCKGLELERTDDVTDADCEPAGGGSSAGGGCTADADCGDCQRCELSTGRCLTKPSC